MTTTIAPRRAPAILRVVVPAVAGVAAAIALSFQGSIAPVIMLCAAIYLFAAVIGRRWGSWVGFAISFVVLAPGVILHNPWISIVLLGVIQIALVIVGAVRGTWRSPSYRLQLWGAILFSILAVVAASGAGLWAGIVTIAALLGHGARDLWHHHLDQVVMRSYAVFCGVLDIALGVLVGVAIVTAGG
jgi:hypothetical protein